MGQPLWDSWTSLGRDRGVLGAVSREPGTGDPSQGHRWERSRNRKKKKKKKRREEPMEKKIRRSPRKPYAPKNTKKALVPMDQSNWRKSLEVCKIKFDDEAKQVFLKEYAQHGQKRKAADAAGVVVQTVRNHVENDSDFALMCEEAYETYRDRVVTHHQSLLLEGTTRRRWTAKGDLIEEIQEYPIPLILAELKRVDPQYRDKQTIDLNTSGGVMVAPADQSPEQWIAAQEALNKSRKAPGEEAIDVTEDSKEEQ